MDYTGKRICSASVTGFLIVAIFFHGGGRPLIAGAIPMDFQVAQSLIMKGND